MSVTRLSRFRRTLGSAPTTTHLSALVHGHYASVDMDMADISNAYHLLAAGLRTAAYFDYVPSAANIADLPSRDEFARVCLTPRIGRRPH